MKTQIEKIKEQIDHLVFRLYLIPETKEETKAIGNLDSNELEVTDQMIENIVRQKAEKLLEEYHPDWKYELERKKGHNSFYIHLKVNIDL